MLYTVISFFLLAVPFYTKSNFQDGIRCPKEYLSIFAFMAIIAVSVLNYRLKPFKNKWLIFFWMWCFASIAITQWVVPVYLQKVVLDMPSAMLAWKEFLYITLAILTIWCVSSFTPNEPKTHKIFGLDLTSDDNKNPIANVVAWAVIIMSLYGIVQALGLDEMFRVADYSTRVVAVSPLSLNKTGIGQFSHRIVGTIGNPSLLAIWISMCLPVCLYLRRKWGYVAFILGIIVLILTKSAIAIMGAFVGISVYLFINYRKTFFALLAFGLIVLSLLWHCQFFRSEVKTFLKPKGRIEVHKETWKLIAEKPMLGYGLGTFEHLVGGNPDIVNRLDNQNWKELHDEYGQIWFAVGWIGLALFLMAIASSIRMFLGCITLESSAYFASMLAFLAMSAGYFTMRVAPISFYGVIFAGLFYRTIRGKG